MWPWRPANIESELRQRKIELLLHSTHLYRNLPGILESGKIDTAAGLIARLGRERAARYLHDPQRYERFTVGLDCVNCALTLPNVELLYRRSKGDWKSDWVHCALDLELLSGTRAKFCAMSAAHDRGRHVDTGLGALRAMFAEHVEGMPRDGCSAALPTHPQAEVLIEHAIAIELVTCIIAASEEAAREIRRLCEYYGRKIDVEARPQLFVWPERFLTQSPAQSGQ
jgi:hypothetical protein